MSENEQPVNPTDSNKTVAKTISVTQTLPEGTFITNSVTISIPSTFEEDVIDAIAKTDNLAIDANKEGREWLDTTKDALTKGSFDSIYKSISQNNSNLKREIEFTGAEGKPVPIRIFGLTVPKDGTKISGEKAVLFFRNKLGGGIQGRIPLPNSGFWIELRAPTESQIITLQEMFTLIKSDLGRSTYGLAFSAVSSYIYETLWNFIEQENLIINTSIEVSSDTPAINLRDIISEKDLPIIIIGLLHTMYPSGINYKRACAADPQKCTHIETGKLSLQYLPVFDDSRLTETQIEHLSKKIRQSVRLDDVKKYQKELPHNQKRNLNINYDSNNPDAIMVITLKPSSLNDYFTASHKWITEITEIAEKVLADQSDKDKKQSVTNRAKATRLRQYSHYIESIKIDDIELDNDKIDDYLGVLSEQDDLFDKIVTDIKKYIENSSISFIAIDKYKCSKCGEEQDSGHPTYIPLDALQLFFDSHHQRLRRITSNR